MEAFAERLLLHQRLTQPHVHAALDLALDEQRVDGAADVMRDPYLVYVHQPGAVVCVEVDHARRVAVRGARSDARALVRSCDLGRRVAAGRGQRPEPRLGQDARLLEAEIADPTATDAYGSG